MAWISGHFKLRDPFALYIKCSKCEFEIEVSSKDKQATVKDWDIAQSAGINTKPRNFQASHRNN